jgi:tRNA-dihydrouridine synthase C
MRVQKGKPFVVLAPMEGITDAPLRGYFTRTGYYDFCVTEFVRVSSHVLPPRVFRQEAPEILTGAKTSSGIPVVIQLLGGDPEKLAQTALHAVEAGAKNIDINFGCPAPTVNRHDGGATLLKYPDRLEGIVRMIRDRLPKEITVSAKLRLGFDDPHAIYENARRAEQGGADWITIHGRTRMQGYIPPAYWKPIGQVREALSIPVIANGEIFSLADFYRCREESGAEHFMLGRSALGVPGLALEIRNALGLPRIPTPEPLDFPAHDSSAEWARAFADFAKIYAGIHAPEKRLKQWTKYLAKHHPKKGFEWWDEIKVLNSVDEIVSHLRQRPPHAADPESTHS